jgi:hypothetical protein
MIGQKCPSIAGRLSSQQKFLEPFKKILTILIIPKDISTLDSSDYDVVQNSASIKAS